MIDRIIIEKLIAEQIEGSEKFLVDLKVSPANRIEVFIDGVKGVSIRDCVNLSRHIESSLDREEEDFELSVSSPGAEEPFKVKKQYEKNVGRKIKVLTTDGATHEGTLIHAGEHSISIETSEKKKKEQGKGKILVKENITLELDKVKQASVILSFK